MTDTLLRSIYYDIKSPASFSSAEQLYRAANKTDSRVTRHDVQNFLSGEIAYTLHRRIVRKFDRNPVVATHFKHLAQADLIDVSRYKEYNNDFTFILTLIDVFTKFAFAIPLKSKSGTNVSEALDTIFRQYRPSSLQTDEGREFTNNQVQNLLKEYLIDFYLAKNERIKCAIVERFQRTLMTKISKYFTANGTTRYLGVIQDFIDTYNNTYHHSIKMTPLQAISAPPSDVFRNLYGFSSHRDMLKVKSRKDVLKQVGKRVRIPQHKNRFQKGYMQNFTDEIYTISNTNNAAKKPVYQLKDYKGGIIKGNFYPEELQVINNHDTYRVSVLRERLNGKRKEYLVQYTNFPNLSPEWIPAVNLKSLK